VGDPVLDEKGVALWGLLVRHLVCMAAPSWTTKIGNSDEII
jgi:hypothetical protein